MKNSIRLLMLFLLPTFGFAADAPLSLPKGFAQEPNCIPGAICLAEDVKIFGEDHFAAIELAAREDGRASLKVKDVFTPDQTDRKLVRIRMSYTNAASTRLYTLEMTGSQWAIVDISFQRE